MANVKKKLCLEAEKTFICLEKEPCNLEELRVIPNDSSILTCIKRIGIGISLFSNKLFDLLKQVGGLLAKGIEDSTEGIQATLNIGFKEQADTLHQVVHIQGGIHKNLENIQADLKKMKADLKRTTDKLDTLMAHLENFGMSQSRGSFSVKQGPGFQARAERLVKKPSLTSLKKSKDVKSKRPPFIVSMNPTKVWTGKKTPEYRSPMKAKTSSEPPEHSRHGKSIESDQEGWEDSEIERSDVSVKTTSK